MQKVTFDQLKLLARSTVSEDSQNAFNYDEFKKQYAIIWKEVQQNKDRQSDKRLLAYKKVVDLLKNDKSIKLVGEGSSRTAFAIEGGLCLKVAKFKYGVEQNKAEFQNVSSGKDFRYYCFAQVYDSADDWSSILTECCSEYDDSFASKLYGCRKYAELRAKYILELLLSTRFNLEAAIRYCKKVVDEGCPPGYDPKTYWVDVKSMYEIMKNTKAQRNQPKYHVIYDLIQFYKDHGGNDDQLAIGDIQSPKNQGMAIRDGQIVPVILDAGFTREIGKKYYG